MWKFNFKEGGGKLRSKTRGEISKFNGGGITCLRGMERIFILYKGKVKLDSRWREIKYIREIGRGGNTIILSVEEEGRKV